MLAGYAHLLAVAERLRWNAETIDLSADRGAITRSSAAARAQLTELVAGFCLAERAVADGLGPYVAAAGSVDDDPLARECFAVQAGDEARHARFFERVWSEALGRAPGDVRAAAPPGVRSLFEVELPAAARALAADARKMGAAVGLYHLVLEGIAFAVGQDALAELAGHERLRGIAEGTARVRDDERWHVGLGVLHLQRLGAPLELAGPAHRAIAGWGPRIATPARTQRVLAAHTRRLTIAAGRASVIPG